MNVWKTQMSQLFSFPTGLDPIFHHLFLPTFRMSSGTNTWLFGRSRSLSCPWPCRDYFCTSFPHGPQICVHWWGKAPLYKGTLWKLNTVAWPSRNKLKQLTQSMDAVDILLNPFKVPLISFKCDFLVWSGYYGFTVISWYSLETGLVWVTTQFIALVYRFGFWGWKSRRCRSLAEAWYVGCMRGLAVFRVKVEDGQCQYQKITLSHQAPQIISLHQQKGRFLVLFQYQREQAFGALGWRQARWCKGWTACWCWVDNNCWELMNYDRSGPMSE